MKNSENELNNLRLNIQLCVHLNDNLHKLAITIYLCSLKFH
jgi:hypothetical protein